MIVPDASILANAVADDGPDGERARSAFEPHPDAVLPDLADVEVLSVLRRHVRLGTISEARAAVAKAFRPFHSPRPAHWERGRG